MDNSKKRGRAPSRSKTIARSASGRLVKGRGVESRGNLFDLDRKILAEGQFALILNTAALKLKLSEKSIEPASDDSFDVVVSQNDIQVAEEKGVVVSGDDIGKYVKITFPNLYSVASGDYDIQITYYHGDDTAVLPEEKLTVPNAMNFPQPVTLRPTVFDDTEDEDLWEEIKGTSLDFNAFQQFLDEVLCSEPTTTGIINPPTNSSRNGDRDYFKNRLPFINVDEYSLLKFATDAFMRHSLNSDGAGSYFSGERTLPYYTHLNESLDEILNDYEVRRFDGQGNGGSSAGDCAVRETSRLDRLPMIELIWSYWMEQAMLVQTMNAVSLRFQNMKGIHEIEPLTRFDTSPLRPLSNILWGFIQDEQHRTTLYRRVHEYHHAYNLSLIGKAVPQSIGVDNRSQFLGGFHNLLHQASIFFKDYDDMTRRADGFPLLTALREVHLLLAEGNHNAYFNMTWNTRAEMLTMQYMLARQEMRLFLGGRPMVPYPEQWMDKVDTMKNIQGWDNTSMLHYYDLANSGEKLLLGIRYGDWTDTSFTADDASNWAVAFRDHAQKYINAYRVVTNMDLSMDAVRHIPEQLALQPSILIQRRLEGTKARPSNKLLNQKGAVLRQY